MDAPAAHSTQADTGLTARQAEKAAYENFEKGEDIELTQKQLINIFLKINQMQPEEEGKVEENITALAPVMETSYGLIFLN